MAHRQKNDDFITQGLRRYPEARATVRAFESALAGSIEKCIARHDWVAWKPAPEGFEPYQDRSNWDAVGLLARGRMKHGVKTELWVWVEWDTTVPIVRRTFRLELWPTPVWQKDLQLQKAAGRIAVHADRKGFYVISDSPDLDGIFARLLATFDRCAAAAAKPRKR